MKINFLLLYILFVSNGIGQNKYKSIDLSEGDAIFKSSYLSHTNISFDSLRVIGLGESTHGTSEFTKIRFEIFKYLVTNYHYDTFFLEADFGACARMDRYIKGNADNPKECLAEVKLWPWITEELLQITEWMKDYNTSHSNILSFVGCDMQLLIDDEIEMKRFLSSNYKFSESLKSLPSLKFNTKDTTLLQEKYKDWTQFYTMSKRLFKDEEKLRFNTITQWFESELSQKVKYNFRDSCMGNNIANYLVDHPQSKGIYFAHNGHVSMLRQKYGKRFPLFKWAGCYLSERLGAEYFAIALDFKTGSFNAINYVDDEFVMNYFELNKSNRKSLSRKILRGESTIKYIKSNNITKSNLKIHSIGAIYGQSKSGYKIPRYETLDKKIYDAFILINKGSPTHLIKTSTKNKD